MGLEAVSRQKNKQSRPEGLANVRPNLKLQREIGKLERDVGADQEGTVLERATRAVLGNPFVKTVLDIVSRPNYAVAGAYEEITSARGFVPKVAKFAEQFAGGGPLQQSRVSRELFSGIGQIQGEKKAFGEVFEDLGYGAGGSLSQLHSFSPFFSETGEGIRFQRGGFFDWTARGSLGLGLDIVADPVTYLTFGTAATAKTSVKAGAHYLSKQGVKKLKTAFEHGASRGLLQGEADRAARAFVARQIDKGAKGLADQGGIKLFGATIVPGEVIAKPARSVTNAVVKYMHQTTLGQGILDIGEGVGRVFNRDHRVRKIPEYVARKQEYLAGMDASQRDLREMVEDLYRGTSKEDRVAITNFIDSGGKTKIAPKLAPLVKKTNDIYAQFARVEQELGLLENVRLDYVFHTYTASPKRVKEVMARFDPSRLRATLRGSQEARSFDTLEEARKFLAEQGIKPIEDSAELILRRGLRHIHAVDTHRFFTDVANRWGVRAIDDALEPGAAKLSSELADLEKAISSAKKVSVDDPAGVSAKVWYHGSGTSGLTAEGLDPFIGSHESLFGQGIYLTDSPSIAASYTKLRGRGSGAVYQARVKVGNVLDLEKKAPANVAKAIRDIAKNLEFAGASLPEITGETTAQLLTSLRKAIRDLSRAEDIPSSEFVEVFQDLAVALRKEGVDALTYTGGQRVGKLKNLPKHRVLVVLDPHDGYSQVGRTGQIPEFKALENVEPHLVLELSARKGTRIEDVRKLSEVGQREFLRRKFQGVTGPQHLERLMNKYREFEALWPETTNQAIRTLKTVDGQSMARLDLPEFKGITMPVDIAQDIRDFNRHFIDREEVTGLLRAYDKVMNGFKVGVTVIFPAFHFRNNYSNVVQQFTDVGISALNPRMHIDAVRMLAGDVNGSFLAKHGRTWGYAEVVYEAKRRGVIADYSNIFETFGDKIKIRVSAKKGVKVAKKRTPSALPANIFTNPQDWVRHPIDNWKRFGGIIENESRLTLFTNYLRRGLDPETAAGRVNKVLFDYKNLSRVERDVFARMFPFYRWTRKNIALQAERLARNPAQAAIQAKLTRQNRTDPTLLPSYLRGTFVFTIEADRDGKLKFIRGLDLPISDLNILGDPLREITGSLSPAIKLLPELSMDMDFFRRRTISETSTPLLRGLGPALDLLPQRVKKAIDFSKRKVADGTTEYRMNPTLTYIIIKSWALSRVYGTAQRVMRAKSNSIGEGFLDVVTGFRLQDVDVDTAANTIEFEYRDFLAKKAVAMGIRRRFSTTFVPKEESQETKAGAMRIRQRFQKTFVPKEEDRPQQ